MTKKISLIHILIIFIVLLGAFSIFLVIQNGIPKNTLTEQEASIVGSTLYYKAMDYYWCDFEYETDGTIQNYDDVISLFTSNGRLNFEKSLGIRKDGDKYYETESTCARESNPEYIETELKLESVNETEIKISADSTYCRIKVDITDTGEEVISDECNYEVVKELFLLKKNNNIWYIDDFVLPN